MTRQRGRAALFLAVSAITLPLAPSVWTPSVPKLMTSPEADHARWRVAHRFTESRTRAPEKGGAHGTEAARRIAQRRAKGPRPFEKPQEAMEFFLAQRLPPGQTVLPLEHLRNESLAIRQREQALPGQNNARPGGRDPTQAGVSIVWDSLGPGNIGGRTRALKFDPTDPDIMYAAGVAGGIFKSLDGGASWRATDDLMLNLAVSSLVMDPFNPNVLYAGTGEGFFNGDAVRGLGIFKSVDAGETWTQVVGADGGFVPGAFFYVNDLAISPNDPDRLYACTRTGVWRSLNGGQSWSIVLRNPREVSLSLIPATNGSFAGCTDMAIRSEPASGDDVVFAAFGSFRNDGLFRSTNNGTGWRQMGTVNDVRTAFQGRMALAIAPGDNDTIYVSMAENGFSGNPTGAMLNVFRSTDGGETWEPRLNFSNPFSRFLLSNLAFANGCFGTSNFAQGWYDNVIAVDPLDPDIVWVGGIDLFRSNDGGRNFSIASYWWFDRDDPNHVHADHHALVFHPDYNGTTNQTLYSGSDGGLARTDNARATTSFEGCPPGSALPSIRWTGLNNGYGVTQFYHGDAARGADLFGGGTQDNGTVLVPSDDTPESWTEILGADGGHFAIDPTDTRIMYAETQGFPRIRKSTDGGRTFFLATNGITDGAGLFITPFELDRNLPTVLWTGGNRPWRTINGAALWTLAGPNLPAAGRIAAIAIAPSDSTVVYLGFENGYVARTTGGLSPSPGWALFGEGNGLNVDAFVSSMAVSPDDPNVAYCTYSTFGVSHILRTRNGGNTWTSIDGPRAVGVPDVPAHWIAVRPCNPRQLFVGTELGVFVSDDAGETWQPANIGLAHTVVETLAFQDHYTLVAFTHGRGAFRARLACPCDPEAAARDCNENGEPDECDIAFGVSIDGDGDGIPDECTPVGACCQNGGTNCSETTAAECNARGGRFAANGAFCTGDGDADGLDDGCRPQEPTFVQGTPGAGALLPSHIDLLDGVPNGVLADDFRSDGRPIHALRWWGGPLVETPLPGGLLYASDPQTQSLGTVNPNNGRFTLIGTFSGARGPITEIQWSPDGATLYATTGAVGNTIHTIDPSTGSILTSVSQSRDGTINGLTFSAEGTLLGTFSTGRGRPSELVRVDTVTGQITSIGPTGFAIIGGLTFDPAFSTLYGITSGGDVPPKLLVLDPQSGAAAAALTTTMPAEASSLEFTIEGRLLTGGADGFLYELDRVTGAARRIGSLFSASKLSGLSQRPAVSTLEADVAVVDDYRLDDGSAETALGLPNGDLIWLNQFTVRANLEMITGIRVAWGDVPEGHAAKALVYRDPNNDGDPTDAVLVASADTTVVNPNSDTFVTVDVPDAVVGQAGDSFFAGVVITHSFGESPAALDTTVPAGRSWLAGHGLPGQADLQNLADNELPPLRVDDVGTPGNWLLRANATTPPPPDLGLTPDGWFVAFHEPVEPGGPLSEALAMYYCDGSIVDSRSLPQNSCDGRRLDEYVASLSGCCLLLARSDERSGARPADADAFSGEPCMDYSLTIQAAAGVQFFDDGSGECELFFTGKQAGGEFWGWQTADAGLGASFGLQPVLTGTAAVAGGVPRYGSWQSAFTTCSAPHMAFALLSRVEDDTAGNDEDGLPAVCTCAVAQEPAPELIAGDTSGTLVASTANRYLIFHAGESRRLQAVRITPVDLPEPLSSLNGATLWVGPPTALSASPSKGFADPVDPDAAALTVSELQCEPHFEDWTKFARPIHVYHPLVVPGGRYVIDVIDRHCDLSPSDGFSAQLVASTSVFGDVAGSFSTAQGVWTAPDFTARIASDVVAVLDALIGAPAAPSKPRADLVGFDGPNADGAIRISDALAGIDAALGKPAALGPAPLPCP